MARALGDHTGVQPFSGQKENPRTVGDTTLRFSGLQVFLKDFHMFHGKNKFGWFWPSHDVFPPSIDPFAGKHRPSPHKLEKKLLRHQFNRALAPVRLPFETPIELGILPQRTP